MKFTAAPLAGVSVIESEQHKDERGYFMRVSCELELGARDLPQRFVQTSLSFNPRTGTVRGLHFQWPPSNEGKLVRCLSGAIHDVMVDLRPGSATFLQHFAIELSEANARAVYIPPGFAHGFQTLQVDARVLYQMTDVFQPTLTAGFSFDDPAFGISWPLPVTVINARDRDCPAFDARSYCAEFERRAAGVPT